MSYHKSNFGKFAPRGVADVDGYVPESGDDWRDMRWDLGPDDPDEGSDDDELQDKLSGFIKDTISKRIIKQLSGA